jgi:proteasome activator subunit 4
VADVKVDWHVPSQGEIDFVVRTLKEFVEPTVASLEELVRGGTKGKVVKMWANDFCVRRLQARKNFLTCL